MTLDQVVRRLTEIARDESAGPDRLRALKMLAAMAEAPQGLEPPKTRQEVVARVVRLANCVGRELFDRAVAIAHPGADLSD